MTDKRVHSEDMTYARGDVVQIIDEEHPWCGCLLVVTSPRAWGVQGFVSIPESNAPGSRPSEAYTRIKNEQIAHVGRVALEMA